MASHVGLFSIVCSLLNVDDTDNQLKRCKVRRGYLERVVIFPDITSVYYLDCIISNDDDVAVKEVFNTNANANANSATSLFALHKAAWGGSLKVVQALLELLDSPAQRNDQSRTPLHMAVLCGHADVVRILVDSNESKGRSADAGRTDMINSQDNDLKSPYILATELGHVEIARYLVQSGTDLALKDGAGKTAVHYAVLNSLHILKALLTWDKSVIDMKDQNGRTPLHFAAKYGVIGAATSIVEAAREVGHPNFLTALDEEHMTPLHLADQHGHAKIVDMIITEDDRTAWYPDKDGSLPEDVAAQHGHLSVIRAITRGNLERGDDLLIAASSSGQTLVVEYLIQNKINPNGEDDTPQRPMIAAAANGWSNVIHILLKHHADVYLPDSEGLGPLHHAAKNGNKDVVLMILTHENNHGKRENVNVRDSSLYTPLHYAASEGHVEVMELLLAHGADIHARTKANRTLLHLAVGNASSINWLLDNSADVEAEDVTGRTALCAAVQTGCLESVRLLLDRGASLGSSDRPSKDALYSAISRDQASMVEEMFRRDRNGEAASQWECMRLAVISNALNVLKSMVSKAPEAATMISDHNTTLLWVAAGHTHLKLPDMLTLLLEAGSDVNHQGPEGTTPLMEAACIGNTTHVRQLIEWKADVKCRNGNGDTALSLAGHPNVVRLLLEKGADPNLVNDAGMTALHLAIVNNKMGVIDVILAHQGSIPVDVDKPDGEGFTAIHLAIMAQSSVAANKLIDHGAEVDVTREDGSTYLDFAITEDLPETLVVLLGVDRPSPSQLPWDYQALVTAYWSAVKKAQGKSIEALLGVNGALAKEISKEGSNGLEEYLYLRLFEEGDIADGSLPAQFVESGLDPFKRRPPTELFRASTSALGLKELRITTEFENPNFWTRLAPLVYKVVGVECDQDDWNIHHFLHQAMPRKQYTRYRKKFLWQTKTPTALVWPPLWQRNDDDSVETRLEILTEGLEASFSARPADEDPVTIRSNFPFPPRGPGIVYFEVSILLTMTKKRARVVIGLSGEFTNQADAVPGRNVWSIGYDGIDGKVYEEAEVCNETAMSLKPYGVNRTVGCGIDYQEGEYFFTYNGEVVFHKSSNIIYRKLYPSIGHYGGGAVTVSVNFGKDTFKWDMANLDEGRYKRLR
ncbi:hypothetical protein MKX08_010662 [Trichoderma sp. CBMAI-0020]|nr:hypothetical protein MKX08_010662 [Trichoderma sp. CBMAI-0020]